jgi:hypothetical protein
LRDERYGVESGGTIRALLVCNSGGDFGANVHKVQARLERRVYASQPDSRKGSYARLTVCKRSLQHVA